MNHYHSSKLNRLFGLQILAFLALLNFGSFISCSPIEEKAKPWKSSASDQFNLYPIEYEDKLLLTSICEGQPCLRAVYLNSGKTAWSWLDVDNLLPQAYYNLKPYIFDGILVLPLGPSLIAIELNSGKTLWLARQGRGGESFVEGLGTQVLRTYYDNIHQQARIFAFDLYTGKSKQINSFTVPGTGKLFVRTPAVVPTVAHDTFCIAGYTHYIPKGTTRCQLAFWQMGDSLSVDWIPIYPENDSGDGITQQGVMDGVTAYWVAGQEIIALNLESREIMWRTSLPHGMLTSRLVTDGVCLFYACENEVLYALNKRNGKILWQCPIAGTPSRIHFNREQLYLIGGSDSQLYIINKKSGQIEYQYAPSELGLDKGSKLRRSFYAGQEKLVLTDYKNWWAYDLRQNGSPIIDEAYPR